YEEIEAEYRFVEDYKRPYKDLPYPPIFVTVDAVVVQAGNILLVERGGRPGKGLWALPGGFLNAHERIEDAVYRELREETKIAVPEKVLRGSTEAWEVFDAVHRSSRGRTITHAALINLEGDDELPRIKGSDDAKKAKWFPLTGAGAIHRDQVFEDHYSIMMAMTAKL
ncbi:MAG: NUDIX domain-containing protein, partial [Verrucomicrobiaceae bacterium]